VVFQLEGNETLPAGIKRIVREQADIATERLLASGAGSHGRIHTARQCFKRVRAALALVRGELGPDVFAAEHRCFRDAGRLLAKARDASVAVSTLDSLGPAATRVAPNAVSKIRRRLATASRHETKHAVEEDGALARAAVMVATATERFAEWPLERDRFEAVRDGLEQTYRRGRRAARDARRVGSAELLHELRKPVKCLWHEAQIIRPVFPSAMGVFAGDLHRLADLLSEHHDLAVLMQAASATKGGTELDALFELINRRSVFLRARAEPLAERLFAEKPAAFVARVGVYWHVWREDTRRRTALSVGAG
jgi:CHAD domain-containing protein